jgi:c(7)-type cytochrome triheme protein
VSRARDARRSAWRVAGTLALALGIDGAAFAATTWLKLAADGVHDPASPALRFLQEPGEALAPLPRDTVGNQVNWMKALESGAIKPRSTIDAVAPPRMRHTEILLRNTANQPMVIFPHRQHTAWVDCVSCHSGLFEMKAGATKFTGMFRVLSGEKCGQCHGAVAFPLTECRRCHSVMRGSDAERAFDGKILRDTGGP